MPKKKEPKDDPSKQFERFVEASKKIQVDETIAEASFKRIAKKSKAAPIKATRTSN